MSAQHEFYLARAADARRDADAATLDNVRDRCIRSAEAWDAMATRTERGDRQREKLADEKAAARAAADEHAEADAEGV